MTVGYCPAWVFDMCCADAATQYLAYEFGQSQIAAKYARGLSKYYLPVEPVEIEVTLELLLEFLAEIDAGEDAVLLLSSFGYYTAHYRSPKLKRKLTSTLFSPASGTKTREYNDLATAKRLKAYIYSIRSGASLPANASWSLSLLHELPHLAAISKNLTTLNDVTFIDQ